jgi:hypothetical protein
MEQRLCLSTVSPIRQKSDGIGIADWLASSVPPSQFMSALLYLATVAVLTAISRRGRSGSAAPA